MNKKYAIYILVGVQIVFIFLLGIYAGCRDRKEYTFSESELVYIEDDGEGEIILSPYRSISVGSYAVDMVYKLEGISGTVSFVCYGKSTEDILTNHKIALYKGKHKLYSDFYSRWYNDGFSVKVQLAEGASIEISEIKVYETNTLVKQILFYALLIFALSDLSVVGYLYGKKNGKDWRKVFGGGYGYVLPVAFIASLPLTLSYLLEGQDLEFHLLRIEGLYEALRCGQFPVRIHPNYMEGYGYPTGIFYPEFFLYIPALLRFAGIPLMHAYKWFLALQNIATAGVALYTGRILFKEQKSAVVFCLLYTLSPYRLLNMYYRGAVGESLAMMFLPFIAAGMYLLLSQTKDKKCVRNKAIVVLVVGMSGILQSHILSCEMVAFFVLAVIILCWKKFWKKEVWIAFAKACIITVLLNLWFIIPFVEASCLDVKVLLLNPGVLTPQGLNIWQLFAFLPNASGYSKALQEGIAREMPFQLGWAMVILFGIVLYSAPKIYRNRKDINEKSIFICSLLGVIAIWMTTYLFPWNWIGRIPKLGKIMNTVQFPWRYLGIGTLLLMIAGLLLVEKWKREEAKHKLKWIISVIAVITSLWFFQSMIENAEYYAVYGGAGLNTFDLVGEEYLYQGTDLNQLKDIEREEWYNQDGTNVVCQIENLQTTELRLPLLYYPWYVAKDKNTGEYLTIIKGENNVAYLNIPTDYSGTVEISMEETVLWKFGNVISILTFIGIIVTAFISCRQKNYDRKADT